MLIIMFEDGEVYLSPRYYEDIDSGTYKLRVLSESRIRLEPDKKVRCKIEFLDKTYF